MKSSISWLAVCAIGAFAGMAQADCADDLARLTGEAEIDAGAAKMAGTSGRSTEGIAKDGSLAPLEAPDAGTTEAPDSSEAITETGSSGSQQSSDAEGIAKDGSLVPLETSETEPGTEVAMSGQDVQAQQEGEPTATQEAETATANGNASDTSVERDDLLQKAQDALASGDEEACLKAIEQIDTL